MLADKRLNKTDVPHDYLQFAASVKGRYVRLTNYNVPDGTFSVADLRIFGNEQGNSPAMVKNFILTRTQSDKREVKLKWDKRPDAVGYNIRFGTQADKLYHNYQVLGADSLTIRSLNRLQQYFFTIDAFNENGIKKGVRVVDVK